MDKTSPDMLEQNNGAPVREPDPGSAPVIDPTPGLEPDPEPNPDPQPDDPDPEPDRDPHPPPPAGPDPNPTNCHGPIRPKNPIPLRSKPSYLGSPKPRRWCSLPSR
jgi:hypothetical protein